MSQIAILKISYAYFAINAKPGVAGKLLEMLGGAVQVRPDYSSERRRETYRIEPSAPDVSVSMITKAQLLPPKREDLEEVGADEALRIGHRTGLLLKGGRS